MDSHGNPSASPTDEASETFALFYYTFITLGLPLLLLLAGLYCWVRHRLWDCCFYYDVESALETRMPAPREPRRWELDSTAVPPPERIQEISAACTDCAICTGSLDGGGERCLTLPLCGHRFHKVCVYIWLHRKATCPVCRRFYPFPVRSKLNLLVKQEKHRLLGCV